MAKASASERNVSLEVSRKRAGWVQTQATEKILRSFVLVADGRRNPRLEENGKECVMQWSFPVADKDEREDVKM